MADKKELPAPHSESSCDSRWGLDPGCRQRLADYCDSLPEPRRRLSAAVYSENAKDAQIISGSTSSSCSSRSSASDDSPYINFPSRDRATVQPCNCATVQPCNCATVQPCNRATAHSRKCAPHHDLAASPRIGGATGQQYGHGI